MLRKTFVDLTPETAVQIAGAYHLRGATHQDVIDYMQKMYGVDQAEADQLIRDGEIILGTRT